MNCSGCGSRLTEDAIQCDLCGTPVSPDSDTIPDYGSDTEESPETMPSGLDQSQGEENAHASGASPVAVFCNQCGWKNPGGSNFCSKCGAKLQPDSGVASSSANAVSPVAAGGERKIRDKAAVGGVEPGAGKRMAMLIGLAILVIFAVYMIISVGGDSEPVRSIVAPDAPAEPALLAEYAGQEQQLLADLQNLNGAARIDKQRELLTLYFTARRFDLAGAQAEQIAIATGDEDAWIDSGNFYYDWMETSDPVNKAYYSQKATSAYQSALEINPDNLDVRTDMAVAYLYDPTNSMMAIQETMKVLEADSNHVQANFNRGIMLWQINRLEEAEAQFERVLSLVEDPEDPVAIRATDALSALRSEPSTPDS